MDLAVFGRDDEGREILLAIGEAKWNETMGMGHLERLRHIRAFLHERSSVRTHDTRLLCFSGAGFTDELRRLAEHDAALQLVDLPRLYTGD